MFSRHFYKEKHFATSCLLPAGRSPSEMGSALKEMYLLPKKQILSLKSGPSIRKETDMKIAELLCIRIKYSSYLEHCYCK